MEEVRGGGNIFRAREVFPDGKYPRVPDDLVKVYEMCYNVKLLEIVTYDLRTRILFVSPDQRYMLARYNWTQREDSHWNKGFLTRRTEEEMDKWITDLCTTFRHWWFKTTGDFLTYKRHEDAIMAEKMLKEKLR